MNIPPPAVIVGCYHSGTRAVVQVLEALGAYTGNINNPWLENEFFLRLHQELLIKELGIDAWYDWNFAASFSGEYKYKHYISQATRSYMRSAQTVIENHTLWCWKCPRSALFLGVWQEIFPQGRYIHIIRDGRDVSCSLVRDNPTVFTSTEDALRLWEVYVERIHSYSIQNLLEVRYENLRQEVDRIAHFIGVNDERRILMATRLIKPHTGAWKQRPYAFSASRLLQTLGYEQE